MSENKEPLGNIREQLTVKTAECNASNAKVGTLMGQLLDAETKIIVLNDVIKSNKKELEELRPLKSDLDEKNKTVFAQGSNVTALRDKISLNKKQHQEELEHHGRTIDDYQKKLKEKEKMIETMGEEIKSLKLGKKKKGAKVK